MSVPAMARTRWKNPDGNFITRKFRAISVAGSQYAELGGRGKNKERLPLIRRHRLFIDRALLYFSTSKKSVESDWAGSCSLRRDGGPVAGSDFLRRNG